MNGFIGPPVVPRLDGMHLPPAPGASPGPHFPPGQTGPYIIPQGPLYRVVEVVDVVLLVEGSVEAVVAVEDVVGEVMVVWGGSEVDVPLVLDVRLVEEVAVVDVLMSI